MEDQRTAVLGLCMSRGLAERVIDGLLEGGIMNNSVSVLLVDDQKAAGTFGLLADVTLLIIPGLGRAIAAGPIVQTLKEINGIPHGELPHALFGMGLPTDEAAHYQASLRKGAVLLAVHCESGEQLSQLTPMLERRGVTDTTNGRLRQASLRRLSRHSQL